MIDSLSVFQNVPSIHAAGGEKTCSLQRDINANAEVVGGAGILLGMRDISRGEPWSYSSGITTLLGSALLLTAFYRSHPFTIYGRISLSNIAKVSFIATGLVGFNVVYFLKDSSIRE